MKFKIDENLPIEIADLLRSVNYDAVTVIDQGLSSADDNTIIDICLDEDRVLVTLDLDFADIFAYPPKRYAGIMVIRVGVQEKFHIIDTFRQVIPLINTSFSVVGVGKWFLAELCAYLLYSTQFISAKNHLPTPTENRFYT